MPFSNATGTAYDNVQFSEQISTGLVTASNLPATITRGQTYTNGTGAGQIDMLYAKQLTLAATPTTLDLQSLTDLNGAALNFLRIREFIVQNLSTVAAYVVTVGGAGSGAWVGFFGTTTSTLFLPTNVGATGNYATLHLSDPYTVGATTGAYVGASSHLLKLDPGANTIIINVILAGCSAAS